MSETASTTPRHSVPATMEKSPAKKRGKKTVGLSVTSRKPASPSVSKLIIEALSVTQDRVSMSLVALKKALAAAGYDVEKNNNRIKLGLKSLVSKGVLVQTRGTGASGSFKLSKKAAPESTKGRLKRSTSNKTKKFVLPRDSKPPKSPKTNKKAKKPKSAAAKKAVRSGRKAKGAKANQQRKSPAKARSGKPKAAKPKLTQHKANPRKATSKK
uniref:H1.6 linker histone, cluster member n=1 Tax=Prolemur simus TaxID=1328070 RepID=A0A8C8YRJ6_PROSS